ncbi:aftiphilin [Tetranychus urticae]|uniref:Aftiphilin clathrin-binding box domain-containing protein n=1 Tax=Tetranychus urticae TaxID=32264 RepID=T1KV16_TETUR|nr:aftiphilin [Tetranychus urticae]
MSFTVEVNDSESTNTSYPSKTQLDDADFDEFDDFQEASPLINGETINISNSQPFPVDPDKTDSLKSPTSFSKPVDSTQNLTTSLPSLDMIINQSFIKAFNDENDKANESITSDLFNDKTSQSYKIWENLTNLEESTSFRLNWESSHTFQVFLRSLKIDNKNIIDNFFVNTSESSSEPEELTMSKVTLADSQPEVVNTVENQNSSQISSSSPSSSPPITSTTSCTISLNCEPPSLVESTKLPQVSQKAQQTLSESNQNQNSSASSVPKVNFDLNTSGLANPSEEINPSNNLLDVTFFLNNPNFMQPCSSPKATVKANESESATSLQNNELSAKPLSIISSTSTDPFHNLISHMQDASSMRSTTKSSITPSETNKIFEELPLLSFMRTKLMMFPLRDSIKD